MPALPVVIVTHGYDGSERAESSDSGSHFGWWALRSVDGICTLVRFGPPKRTSVQISLLRRHEPSTSQHTAVRRPQTALPPSAQEARQVMGAAQTRRNSARWTVALAVGLRRSEALALQWSDVDLDEGTLSVRRGLHRVSGQGLVYEEPKADRSRRTLALPAPLVEALRAHRAAQVQELNTAGPLRENHDLVFAQPNGRPIQWPPRWHHG